MLKLMASRKLQTALLALGLVGGLAVGTGVVLAWGPNYPDGTSAISGSNLRMWGFDANHRGCAICSNERPSFASGG